MVAAACPKLGSVMLDPQMCPCIQRLGLFARHTLQHHCRPSRFCFGNSSADDETVTPHRTAAYVTVLHIDARHIRPQFRRSPALQWHVQLERLSALWANLRRVNATLPLHCLISGLNVTTHRPAAITLERLRRQGVQLHVMSDPRIPQWVAHDHSSSFAKLAVMNASHAMGLRLIYLDTDVLLLRNLDGLADLPQGVPAFVTRPEFETINTGQLLFDNCRQ